VLNRAMSRRRLLHLGGIGFLGLPQLLQASAGAAGRAKPGRSPSEKSCIFIFLNGGLSHIDSFDPKPHALDGIRGPYEPIATAVPGLQVTELLPRLAKLADRYCLIRSMFNPAVSDGHLLSTRAFLTGQAKALANTPLLGSVVAKLRPAQRNTPSYTWLQDGMDPAQFPAHLSGGFLGPAYAPLMVGKLGDNPAAANFRVKAFDPPADVTSQRLRERYGLLQTLDSSAGETSMRRFQERACDLVTGPDARCAFNLDQEPAALRERYGRFATGQNLLLARRLIEGGVRLVTVNAWMGDFPGKSPANVNTWDMHGGRGTGNIFASDHSMGLGFALPRLDQAVAALLEDMALRGLLANTLVVVAGEFGRTPKIDMLENIPGRNHWPPCYTGLLAGAGIRGGAVYGGSDKSGAYVAKDSPVSPDDFGATIYHALGVSPDTRLGTDGVSNPVSVGKPILDLFG